MHRLSTRMPHVSIDVETSKSTSLTLIDRIKVHDKEAWERLVTLYTPFLHYWCRRWGVSHADADDVLQEVFQAISQNLKDFRREQTGHSFRGWMRGIARNKALSLRRRHKLRAEGGTGFYRQSLLIPDHEAFVSCRRTKQSEPRTRPSGSSMTRP